MIIVLWHISLPSNSKAHEIIQYGQSFLTHSELFEIHYRVRNILADNQHTILLEESG